MSKRDRSRVIRLAEAQAGIPGPVGEHAVVVFRRGPLDIALSLPLPEPAHAARTGRDLLHRSRPGSAPSWRVFYGPPGGKVPA
jgi:hypothetical protein